MTAPQPLRALIENTARTVAADMRYPERQVTALQVLATLELADAVRSMVVELEPLMGTIEITGQVSTPEQVQEAITRLGACGAVSPASGSICTVRLPRSAHERHEHRIGDVLQEAWYR